MTESAPLPTPEEAPPPQHVADADFVTARTRRGMAAGARYTLGGVLVLAAALLVWQLRSVLVLICLGLLLAAGLEPVIQRLVGLGLRRGAAVLVVLLGMLLAVAGFFVVGLTAIVNQLGQLVDSLPTIVSGLGERFPQLREFIERFDLAGSLQQVAQELPNVLATSFGILSGVASGIFATVTVFALVAYFMVALPRIVATVSAVLGRQERVEVFTTSLSRVGGFITGQALISIACGVVSFVFLTIAQVPYAALLALVVGLLDLVPQIGATVGAVVAVTVTLATAGILKALIVLAFFIVYQQIENYVVAPRVFAKTVNLSPLGAFISILVGASLAGVLGAIFALPVAAMVKTVLAYAFRDRVALVRGRLEPQAPPGELEPAAHRATP